jgi:hypothetical protein
MRLLPRTSSLISDDDLPAVLLLIALAASACLLPAQADTFYHLRSGREMWETGALLTRERFSWTEYGQPLPNHWWISQLVFYALYSLGGPFLLTLVAGACALTALMLSWRLTTGSAEWKLVLLVVLFLTLPEWSIRPQAFSLLLLMITLRLVLADRSVFVPPLLVIWANMHAVVILGVAIAGIAALDALFWDRRRLLRAAGVAAASAVAPFVSPLGIHYWGWMLQTVRESRALGLQEYGSAFRIGLETVPLWLVVVVLAIAIVRAAGTLAARERRDRILVLTAVAFTPLAIASVRNIAFFALVAAPALSRLIPTTIALRRRAPARATLAMITIAIMVATGVVALRWRDGGVRLGWRPITPAAVAAVRSCPAPMYNSLYEGGALIWFVPEQRVFMDGRVDVYPQAFLMRGRRADVQGDYKDLFADYGIRCAVVKRQSSMAHALSTDASMHLRFSDTQWAVFVRGGADNF